MFDVSVQFEGADKILNRCGLDEGGDVQRFFSTQILRISDPYVPFRAGVLAAQGRVADEGDAVIYAAPHARVHWYGKLMVDPSTGKGAFHDPVTGRFWSRPNVKKMLSSTDMTYNGAPLRGPRWCERAWIDRKDEVREAMEAYISYRQKMGVQK